MTERGAPRLADRPWPEVGRPVLLVPLGSTEQHGPHLPLDTDTVVASAACEALATRLADDGVDAVVAPAIAYGASGEHQDFPGTISIGTQALTVLLVEYGRSACEWAGRLVFVNGHGGNVEALAAAVPRLRFEGRDVAWLPCAPGRGSGAASGAASGPASEPADSIGPSDPADSIGPSDPHAGRAETSLMLAIAPSRVQAERVEPGNTAPLGRLIEELRAGGVRAVSPNGVLGDPSGANAEEGARRLESIVAEALARLGTGIPDERGCLVPVAPGGTS